MGRTAAVMQGIAGGLALVLSGVVLFASPVMADPADDKARVDREIAKTRSALEAATERAAAAGEAYEEAVRLLPDVERKHAEAQAARDSAKAQVRTKAELAEAAGAQLSAADQALAAAVRQAERSQARVDRLVRDAYTGGTLAQVDALLKVEDPADFMAGLTYLERVNGVQQTVLDASVAARADQRTKQLAVLARKVEADKAKAEAQAAFDEAAAAEAKAAQAERRVAALVAQREDAVAVAQSERAATEKRYQELQAESARIAAEIRSLASGGGSTVIRAGTRLPMPVNGWKSSDFGNRFDPIYKVWRLHAGMDLAAAGGSPIWAAAAGKVFRAGWNGGYGNYTCIYHGTYQGKGFATCYAHQSAILVKVGQQVSQRQLIGRVGTTGASTGNHLHFEVRIDGTPVNPAAWLPTCLC